MSYNQGVGLFEVQIPEGDTRNWFAFYDIDSVVYPIWLSGAVCDCNGLRYQAREIEKETGRPYRETLAEMIQKAIEDALQPPAS